MLPATPLLGRKALMSELCELLTQHRTRLLTLTGAGGTGKTRLALELTSELESAFERVWFVDLTTVRDPGLVVSAVAQTVDVKEAGTQPLTARLQGVLSERPSLLVLDNFEHVHEAAGFVAHLVAHCPELAVIATSREALGLRAEQVYFVEPLPVPNLHDLHDLEQVRQVASVQLFEERARARRAGLRLSAESLPSVAEICVRLDGLPLAIELAAAQAAVFTPGEILKRLQARAGFVATVQRDLPARHRTPQATVAWSYDLLEPAEQAVFRLCGVFSGGFTAAALMDVAGALAPEVDALGSLAQLVTKSLVRVGDENGAGESRFWLLEMIREYAIDQLTVNRELDEARARHADYFVALAERVRGSLRGPDSAAAFGEIAREYGNLRAVFQWSAETGNFASGLRLAGAMYRFWLARGPLSEARDWLATVLPKSREVEPAIRAAALNAAGVVAGIQLDHERARAYFAECLELADALGDVALQASAQLNLGLVAHVTGDVEDARWRLERAQELFVAVGDRSGQASAVGSRGRLARERDDLAEAMRLTEESLRLFESVDNKWGIAFQLCDIGHIRLALDDRREALSAFQQALRTWRPLGNMIEIAECLDGIAGALADGQPRRATQLLGAAEALRAECGGVVAAVEQRRYRELVERVQKRLREDTFFVAWREGRALSMDRAIDLALSGDADEQRRSGSVLSQREQEIAQLIARGQSNNAIAQDLVVSIKTVETHIQHIFRKLNVKRRAEIATWAVREGLL